MPNLSLQENTNTNAAVSLFNSTERLTQSFAQNLSPGESANFTSDNLRTSWSTACASTMTTTSYVYTNLVFTCVGVTASSMHAVMWYCKDKVADTYVVHPLLNSTTIGPYTTIYCTYICVYNYA